MADIRRAKILKPSKGFQRLILGQIVYAFIALIFNIVSVASLFITGEALTSTNPFYGAVFCASLVIWSLVLFRIRPHPFWRSLNGTFLILIIFFGVIRHLDAPIDGIHKAFAVTLNSVGSVLLILSTILYQSVSKDSHDTGN